MASRTVVRFVDDLDGGAAEETVRFALDGVDYELDLSGKHAKALRAALAPYVSAARLVSASGRGSAQRVRQVMQRVNDRTRRSLDAAGEPAEEPTAAAASSSPPTPAVAAAPAFEPAERPTAARPSSGVAGVTFSAGPA